MAKIIIESEATLQRPSAVTLSERIVPASARTEHYLEQLMERVGWALVDADELEAAANEAVATATHRRHRAVNPRLGGSAGRVGPDRRRSSPRQQGRVPS
jgi:hypothetical protein